MNTRNEIELWLLRFSQKACGTDTAVDAILEATGKAKHSRSPHPAQGCGRGRRREGGRRPEARRHRVRAGEVAR